MLRWTVASALDDQALAQGRPPAGLLSARELEVFLGMSFPARRRKWLLGRFAAKSLVKEALAETLGQSPADHELTIGNDPSGAPFCELAGAGRLPWSLSMSRRADLGFAVLSETTIGADLEQVEPRDPGLVRDFFSVEEQEWVARTAAGPENDAAVALIWSAKEAVLKAMGLGLRLDTRRVIVNPGGPPEAPAGWRAARARIDAGHRAGERFDILWRYEGDYVLTIAMPVIGAARS